MAADGTRPTIRLGKVSQRAAESIKYRIRVTAALDQRLARLSNGQRVINVSGALKYLLEQIGSGQMQQLPSTSK